MQQETPTLKDFSDEPAAAVLDNLDVIPAVGKRHRRFMFTISLGFAALFGEMIFFLSQYYNSQQDTPARLGLSFAAFIFSFLIFVASFTLPHLYFRPRYQNYSPIIFLMMEWTASVFITLVGSLVLLVMGIFVVRGDLGAIGELIRTIALYTLVFCILVQGAVMYVRYVRYLYEREMHQSYKVVTIAAVTAVAFLVITLYLLPFDLGRIGTNVPNSDLLSLHVSIRDVWLLSFSLYAFFWHVSVLADH